jgi:hypothetical protein
MEHMVDLQQRHELVPAPGSEEARTLVEKSTFAERQWASRRAGMTHARDRLVPTLIQIEEPKR